MEEIIKTIKRKKPLHHLDDTYIKMILTKYITTKTNTKNPKAKTFREAVKKTRNDLNVMYGQYWKKEHTSTQEREICIKELYQKILPLDTHSILDIACGLNPLTYKYISQRPFFYCNELTEPDCNHIKEICKKEKIKGKVLKGDATRIKLPKTEVTFLFKILEIIDRTGHRNAKILFKKIQSPTIIVSFSTRTLKNQPMKQPRRFWFETFLKEEKRMYTIHKEYNEIFYIVREI